MSKPFPAISGQERYILECMLIGRTLFLRRDDPDIKEKAKGVGSAASKVLDALFKDENWLYQPIVVSKQTLAEISGCGVRTVQRVLAFMEAVGWIEVLHRNEAGSSRVRRDSSNQYDLSGLRRLLPEPVQVHIAQVIADRAAFVDDEK